MQTRSSSVPTVPLVGVLLLLDSLHFVFARSMLPLMSPAISVLYVLGISTVEVGLFALARKQLYLGTLKKHFWFFLAIGFLIAGSTNINYEAVAFIDPGTASLLNQTSILFGLGFGVLWMRDKLTRQQIAGAALTLIGVFIISFQPGDYLRFGSVLAVVAALMYATHAAIVKRSGDGMDFLDFFFWRLFFTTAMLFVFSAVRGALAWPSAAAWPRLILIGTVDVVLSRTLYYIALRRLTMSLHTLILTLTPILSMVWSLLLFDVVPTVAQLVGGAGIIVGVLVVTMNRRNTV